MNSSNKYISTGNILKVEFANEKPVASSDLNELQTAQSFASLISNILTLSPVNVKWTKSNDSAISIDMISFNYLSIQNGDDGRLDFSNAAMIRGGFMNLDTPVIVNATTVASDKQYRLNIFYRKVELNKDSTIYRNGIRTNNLSTITGVATDENNILYPLIDENEELSTRIVYEYTFTLIPAGSEIETPYGGWTLITCEDIDFTINLNYANGSLGIIYNGPRLFDYGLIDDNQSLLPLTNSDTIQTAFVLNNGKVYIKYPATSSWIALVSGFNSFMTNWSYVRINKFLNGDLINKSGYITWTLSSNGKLISKLISDSPNFYTGVANDNETDIQAITRILDSKSVIDGDIFVVKRDIADSDLLYSHTAYIYFDSSWRALDGNYDARNVYFNDNITLAGDYTSVGNVKLSDSVLNTKGKNLEEVMSNIFTKELQPTITSQPYVSLTFSQAGSYEVGFKITPSFTASFNPGSYSYGPETGITVSKWSVTDTNGNSSSNSSGSFSQFTVGDNTDYKITATATHNAGVIADTNMGNDSNPVVRITSGSKSKTSGKILGYRNSFYGTTEDKTSTINSSLIRSLDGKSGKALSNGSIFDVTIPIGAERVIIAYPATLREVTSIIDVNGMNANIKDSFKLSSVSVQGANSYTAIAYKVYILEYANPNDVENTYTVTI